MGFLDKFVDREKLANAQVKDPREIFSNILKQTSGSSYIRELQYNIFYHVYAFRGISQGIGTSTLVANVALAIAEAGLTVCVIDPSILHPVQDVLLKTPESDMSVENIGNRLDWFDMPYTKKSPLHVSKFNKNISVLSFKGKSRSVVDLLSISDSASLVELALTELHNKFDIILIDACDETSSVNTACLQQAQQVIQVWNDSETVLSCLDDSITNAITLSCPLDKMRYVVYSKLCRNVNVNMDKLLEQYRVKCIAKSYASEEIQTLLTTGKTLFQYASSDKTVEEYTNCILDIACHILNITGEDTAKGTITTMDILDGKVEGTYTKALKDYNDEIAEHVHIETNPDGAFNLDTDDGFDLDDGVELDSESNTKELVAEDLSMNELESYEATLEEDSQIGVEEAKKADEEYKKRRKKGLFGKRG